MAATIPAPPETVRRPSAARRRQARMPYLLVVPTVLLLLAALGYPIGWQVVTSLQKYGLKQQFGQPPEWVWAGNYVRLVTDPELWSVVLRSIAFCAVCAVVTLVLGWALALLMQRVGTIARLTLQVALLLAWAMPAVAAMTVWLWLVDWRRGVLNWLLFKVGFTAAAGHNWLAEPLSFLAVAAVIVIWMSVPFVTLSIYAGLVQVSGDIMEAAALDGASGWQALRFIVTPLIRPVLSIVFLLQIIWDLRVFTQIKLLQDAGGVASQTNLLGTYIYQLGTGRGDFGTASTVSIVMLVLTVLLSLPYVRSLMRDEEV